MRYLLFFNFQVECVFIAAIFGQQRLDVAKLRRVVFRIDRLDLLAVQRNLPLLCGNKRLTRLGILRPSLS